jgi:hypothetical protein
MTCVAARRPFPERLCFDVVLLKAVGTL